MKRKTHIYRYLKKQGIGVKEAYRMSQELDDILGNLPKAADQ
jgi:hypothetical protein